jgi:prepilin-type processing-associated H-X9-DG protein
MSIIVNIGTALPRHCFEQKQLSEFMADLFQLPPKEKRALRMMYAKSGIAQRYSAIADFGSTPQKWEFFPRDIANASFPDIEKRMAFYMQHAVPLALDSIQNCLPPDFDKASITHLITVSCTGMSAPGIDIEIVEHLGLNNNTDRTSINFMGCYASVHALKQADAIAKSNPKAAVLIVSVELCTLHFQNIDSHENQTANLLFADGAAAALIVSDEIAKRKQLNGFKIHSFYSSLIYKGKADMAWHLTSNGFLMVLSSYIPALIEQDFKQFFNEALAKGNCAFADINHWAIHPGGRRILEVVAQSLGLKNTDLSHAYEVLKNYGNMSSPTILFVLKSILDLQIATLKKQYTFGAAFGPGLTLESVILSHV